MAKLKDYEERFLAASDLGLNVCARQCRKCLLGKSPHLPWEPAGREKIEKILKEDEVGFTCHEYQNSMCKGFWNEHGQERWYGRLAISLDAVNWVRAKNGVVINSKSEGIEGEPFPNDP